MEDQLLTKAAFHVGEVVMLNALPLTNVKWIVVVIQRDKNGFTYTLTNGARTLNDVHESELMPSVNATD